MPLSQLFLVVMAVLTLGGAEADARTVRPYVDPPLEIDTVPPSPTLDIDTTGSVQAAPPVIIEPSYLPRSYETVQRSGCTTTTYMTGEMSDRPVRVHRC